MAKCDPIIGVWKLNIAKSKFSPVLLNILNETIPKEKTEIYEEAGDEIVLTATATMADGKLISGKYAWPRNGGVAKAQEDVASFTGVTIIETVIAPGEWYATFLKDGKQFIVIHKAISEDSKTMSLRYRGIDARGNPFEQIDVYERQ